MMAGVLDLARLLELSALLLSFAIVASQRLRAASYAAQLLVIGLVALCQAGLQSDWTLSAVTGILVLQALVLWLNRPVIAWRAAFPVVTLCAALLLVVLATASAPSDGLGVPLAIVLLGLLGAAASTGPYGVLSLLNGVVLGMIVVPGLPLRPVLTVALAGLAVVIIKDGSRLVWVRR